MSEDKQRYHDMLVTAGYTEDEAKAIVAKDGHIFD